MTGVIFVVQLPPPVHGMSMISEAVLREVAERAEVGVVDLSFDDISVHWKNLARIARTFIQAVLALLFKPRRRYNWVYICASGGSRQFLDLILVAVAKMRGFRICVHHHSFRYINADARLIAALYSVLGQTDLSVFLGERQLRLFSERYGVSTRNICMSNAVFVNGPQILQPASMEFHAPLCIGFLSNIEITKGIDTFVSAMRALKLSGTEISAIVAGPLLDQQAQTIIEVASQSGLITYLGPVYGTGKEEFFLSIDVFFFPSRYENEAEPLVLYESLARGIPVVAPDIGCIAEMVGEGYPGLLKSADLASGSVDLILELARSDGALADLRARSLYQFQTKKAAAAGDLQSFLQSFDEG